VNCICSSDNDHQGTHTHHNPNAPAEKLCKVLTLVSSVSSSVSSTQNDTHQADLNVCRFSLTLSALPVNAKEEPKKSDRGFFQRLTIWLAFSSIYSLLYRSMGNWLSFLCSSCYNYLEFEPDRLIPGYKRLQTVRGLKIDRFFYPNLSIAASYYCLELSIYFA